MLDYNTLNNLVEFFNKNGIKNIQLESGSTIEVKEGSLLVNGEEVGSAEYIAGDGIVIDETTHTITRKPIYVYSISITQLMGSDPTVNFMIMSNKTVDEIYGSSTSKILSDIIIELCNNDTYLIPATGKAYISSNWYTPLYIYKTGLGITLRYIKDDNTMDTTPYTNKPIQKGSWHLIQTL